MGVIDSRGRLSVVTGRAGQPQGSLPLEQHVLQEGTTVAVAVANRRARMATLNLDGVVEIWDLDGLRHVFSLAGGEGLVSIALDPDGARLAGGTIDGAVRRWDVDALLRTGAPERHRHRIRRLTGLRLKGTRLQADDGAPRLERIVPIEPRVVVRHTRSGQRPCGALRASGPPRSA